MSDSQVEFYTASEWPHGLRCAKCSREFVEGQPLASVPFLARVRAVASGCVPEFCTSAPKRYSTYLRNLPMVMVTKMRPKYYDKPVCSGCGFPVLSVLTYDPATTSAVPRCDRKCDTCGRDVVIFLPR